MKIAVAGKGGSGKTTVAGTLARELARAGRSVLAIDGDTNPMLGISLGVGPEETYRLMSVRQGVDAGTSDRDAPAEEMVETFGTDAPDGVRLVVTLREHRTDPGCTGCAGVTPQRMLDQLEGDRRTVICDLEAGVGAVVHGGHCDLVLVVAEPSGKSIDVARRAATSASSHAEVLIVGNRVCGPEDLEAISSALSGYEIIEIPEDPSITLADQEGRAPIDVDADSPAVSALRALAQRLDAQPVLA